MVICCKWLFCFCLALTHLSSFGANGQADSTLQINESPSSRNPVSVAIPKTPGRKRTDHLVDDKALIKRIELKGNALFPQYGVTQEYISKKLNEAYAGMDPWMTISDMHSLADAMTIAYHEKGLTFNQVFIVPNEIEGNTLTVNVLPGRITEIHLKNNKLYSAEHIKKPFTHLLGTVVYEPHIQDAMKKANMIDGLKIFGFFSMGKHPGQVRLNLHVVSEQKHQASVRVDNFGVNNTGVYRVVGQYSQNNLTGNGDTLSATLISTNEIGNLYGVAGYKRPTPIDNSFAGFSAYSNQFEIVGDFQELGLTGHLEAVSGFYQLGLLKEDNAAASLYSNLAFKNSVITSKEFKDVFAESTQYITLNTQFNAAVIPSTGTSKQALELGLTLGSVTDTDDEALEDTILIARVRYQYQLRWQAGNPAEHVTSADLKISYAPDSLPSAERSVMTGPYGVRGYEPALFSADSVYSFSVQHTLDYLTPCNGCKVLPFAFADYAYGIQNTGNEDDASFSGAGLGIDVLYKSHISSRVTLGFPLAENLSQDLAEDPPGIIVYGYINYVF